jgi:hypothetical protein
MKAAYVGSVRGYQPPVYRPGMGWTAGGTDRRMAAGPAVFSHRRSTVMGRFTVSQHRRTGFRTKVAIIAVVITVVALLTILFGGGAQF